MKKRYDVSILISFLSGIVLLAGVTACSSSEPVVEENEIEHIRDLSELEKLYWSRMESSRQVFIQADVDFMTDMIIHHAQALIMSRLAPENDASRSVLTLAARIINAQDDEIETMQQWLRDRGQPVPVIHIEGLKMTVQMVTSEDIEGHGDMVHHHPGEVHDMDRHDMTHHHDMPGMLTQEQLEELASLHGQEFDRAFLEFMIEHHEGAVIMVRQLFDTDGAASNHETFDLSSDIFAEQITEINRMKRMLAAMGNN